MKVKRLKEYTDALSRFATTREKSSGPETLLGVQKKNGILKITSGSSTAVMVVEIDEHESKDGDYSYTVPARPLLQAVKVLPARSDIILRTDEGGIHLQAAGGGTIDIGKTQMPLREVGYPKRPKDFRAEGRIDAQTLKRMSKLFKAVCAKVTVPTVQIKEDIGYASVVAPGRGAIYANVRFPAEGEDEYAMAGYREFWEALTHFSDDGVLKWGRSGVVLETENATCYSAPYLVSGYDKKTGKYEEPREMRPYPIMVATNKSDIEFDIDRKTLMEVVKGQAPFDEENRVTFEVSANSVRVTPFGSSDGMDLQCEAKGKGNRSVSASYLNSILGAMDSKEVTLRWSGGVPAISISAEDYENWTILLAPAGI